MAKDYEVGYGKPPKHSRFPKGKSGNPGGRKKGARGLKSDLEDELRARHTIRINKQPVTGTKQRLMVMTLATWAATGDLKAAQVLLPLILQILGAEDRRTGPAKLSVQDQTLLNELLARDADTAEHAPDRDRGDE